MQFNKTCKCVCNKLLAEVSVDMPESYPISIVNRQLNKEMKKSLNKLIKDKIVCSWTWNFRHEKIPDRLVPQTVYLCPGCFMEVTRDIQTGVHQKEIFMKIKQRSDDVNGIKN